jgi:hypothetical protein
MTNWAPIRYMGFWDVPRIFLVRHQGYQFLFDCPFDDELDDYAEAYQVYLMPEIPDEELPRDWTTLRGRAIRRLGEIPVSKVQFDPTKRRQIDTAVLDALTPHAAPRSG